MPRLLLGWGACMQRDGVPSERWSSTDGEPAPDVAAVGLQCVSPCAHGNGDVVRHVSDQTSTVSALRMSNRSLAAAGALRVCELFVCELTVCELSVCELSAGEPSAGYSGVGELGAGGLSAGESGVCELSFWRIKRWRSKLWRATFCEISVDELSLGHVQNGHVSEATVGLFSAPLDPHI